MPTAHGPMIPNSLANPRHPFQGVTFLHETRQPGRTQSSPAPQVARITVSEPVVGHTLGRKLFVHGAMAFAATIEGSARNAAGGQCGPVSCG